MTDPKPFLPTEASELPAGPGDYLVPICIAKPDVLMGELMAVVVFETIKGQRVGVPLGMQAMSDLRVALGEALVSLQASEGGSVQ